MPAIGRCKVVLGEKMEKVKDFIFGISVMQAWRKMREGCSTMAEQPSKRKQGVRDHTLILSYKLST